MFTRYAVLGDFEIEISSIVRTNRVLFFFRAWQSKGGLIPLTPSLPEKQHLIKCKPVSTGFLSRLKNLKTLFFSQSSSLRVIEGKIVWKWSERKQKLLRVSESFELSTVNYSKGNQGKSILVRVSTRFELARVRAGVDCSSLSLFNFDGFLCWKVYVAGIL